GQRLGVPDLVAALGPDPQPAQVRLVTLPFPREGAQGSLERRHGCHVAVGEPDRQTVDQKISRSWAIRAPARTASGLGNVTYRSVASAAAGIDARRERVEVGRARQACVTGI